jgi:hypothetical protein
VMRELHDQDPPQTAESRTGQKGEPAWLATARL